MRINIFYVVRNGDIGIMITTQPRQPVMLRLWV